MSDSKLKLFFFFCHVLLCAISFDIQAQYRKEAIPSPKNLGQHEYVSNPNGILSAPTVDSLNRMAFSLDSVYGVEFAIVVVDDFYGDDDFQFALELFNYWGIGKSEENNGLLLFVAKDRRMYRFITGYGMEAILPDGLLKRIGEALIVPNFRQQDYDGGVLLVAHAIRDIIFDPNVAEDWKRDTKVVSFMKQHKLILYTFIQVSVFYSILWIWSARVVGAIRTPSGRKRKRKSTLFYAPFSLIIGVFLGLLSIFPILIFDIPARIFYRWEYLPLYSMFFFGMIVLMIYVEGLKLVRANFKDTVNRNKAVWDYNRKMIVPLLAVPFTWIVLYYLIKQSKEGKRRLIPPEGDGWMRVDRDQIKNISHYLDAGQQSEEKNRSNSYEIWENSNEVGFKLVAFPGQKKNEFETCPSCQYKTLTKPFVRTIQPPTRSREGQGERKQICRYCNHEQILGRVTIPKVSSSSGSSSGGGGSGSSGGGSWGGGRSGGGGAGGRW